MKFLETQREQHGRCKSHLAFAVEHCRHDFCLIPIGFGRAHNFRCLTSEDSNACQYDYNN